MAALVRRAMSERSQPRIDAVAQPSNESDLNGSRKPATTSDAPAVPVGAASGQ
jgi:hypothetical protein